MEDVQITLARAAYQRYGAVTDFKNFQGNPMPAWAELPATIRKAWVAAANPTSPNWSNTVPLNPGDTVPAGTPMSRLELPYGGPLFFLGKTDEVSDGYHTFGELYDHRITLWIALCKLQARANKRPGAADPTDDYTHVWRSERHSDGELAYGGGWFVLGIGTTPGKQITYHLPIDRWDDCAFAMEFEKAPAFDGHTSADVLIRLKTL